MLNLFLKDQAGPIRLKIHRFSDFPQQLFLPLLQKGDILHAALKKMAILLILPISILVNDLHPFLPIRLHVLLPVYLHQSHPFGVDLIVLQLLFFKPIDLASVGLRHFFDLLVPLLLGLKEICVFGGGPYRQFFF